MASGLGAVTFKGTMIDVRVVERAKALITRAERLAARQARAARMREV